MKKKIEICIVLFLAFLAIVCIAGMSNQRTKTNSTIKHKAIKICQVKASTEKAVIQPLKENDSRNIINRNLICRVALIMVTLNMIKMIAESVQKACKSFVPLKLFSLKYRVQNPRSGIDNRTDVLYNEIIATGMDFIRKGVFAMERKFSYMFTNRIVAMRKMCFEEWGIL